MEEKKISVKNVKSFVEGNLAYYKDRIFGSPQYLKEQYHYRLEQCKDDCVPKGECVYCGCPPLKKAWVVESCNKGERFPDLMDSEEWDAFKEAEGIDIDKIMKDHGIQ